MPAVVDRPAQRYVAERATVGVAGFPRIADRLPPLISTLAAFLGEVPAGKYVLDTYVGAPGGLAAATEAVLAWGAAEGLTWDRTDGPDGEEWGGRLEVLRSEPREVPDPAQWVTDLLFRLA
ncbi:AraC family transcriptional regulator [Amycolatopsis sp. NPDC026612]|uniref:AraC family transcriptional regulator n=1 Tax=Amycolatopsis sp. NPDC026612 TaxID=3155466 RepID=UPI0033DBFECE